MRGHPNALNSRLPRPIAPPAMMRIGTVIIVMLAGEWIGVDDLQTAFPQHELCPVMQRALGFAAVTEAGAMMTGVWTRVIQGGTWSATHQQYCSLICADINPPQHYRRPVTPANIHSTPPSVNYVSLCIRARRLVHVDDIMSSGNDPTTLDRARQRFREKAEARYGVTWKPFEPAQQRKRVVGVLVDAQTKTWSCDTEWAEKVERSVTDMITGDDISAKTIEWFTGLAVWVETVMHSPGVIRSIINTSRRSAVDMMIGMLRAAAQHNWYDTPETMLRSWPRTANRTWMASDAMETGWAYGYAGERTVSGTWYRCTAADVITPVQCCGPPTSIEPRDMYIGEAMASTHGAISRTFPHEQLLITDNQAWRDVLVRGSTVDARMMLCIVVLQSCVRGQLAAAHVEGETNVTDQPSRTRTNIMMPQEYDVMNVSPPTWTMIGAARMCHATRQQIWSNYRGQAPCVWRAAVDEHLSRVQPCITGCRHERA